MNLGVDRIELRDLGFRNRRINLGDMDQSLNPFLNLNEDTEVRDVHDGSRHLRADRVLLIQILPRIPDELLDPQREAFLRNVDVQNLDLDLLTLLSHLGGFAKPLGPRDVRNVDQPVNALVESDEDPKIGDVPDSPHDNGAHRVAIQSEPPRVRLGFLHRERDTLALDVQILDDRLDLLAKLDDLGRMPHLLRP